MLNQFIIISPEIMLTLLAMLMQVIAVFYKQSSRTIAGATFLLTLGIVCYLVYFLSTYIAEYKTGFLESFGVSSDISYFKAIVLVLTLMSLCIYYDLMKIEKSNFKIEFVTLILLSTVGVFISISSRDFLLLFCGLELQALSGYALAAFNSKNVKSSEAGLKYFVLGALMSGVMLLGISFLYGFSGSIKFSEINNALNAGTGEFNIGLVVGALLMVSAILFKLSAAPLHMWTPDVYEGSPISSVSYFAVAQKFGMLIVLINILDDVMGAYLLYDLIKIIAIFSMIIGALAAIMQLSLKRLMAYSTILNIGYSFVALCLNSDESNYAALIYMLIYVIGAMGFFACLIALFGKKSDEATFDDLKGIAQKRKAIAASISIIMFSMIGLPPFSGFFGKYYVFYHAIKNGEITLAIIGFLTSVIAAFYYLKVIKFMYFMEAKSELEIIPTQNATRLVTIICVTFTLLFFIVGSNYINIIMS